MTLPPESQCKNNNRHQVSFIGLWSGLLALSLLASPAQAEWTVRGTGILFWTDDIGIFSATRRLSRDGDPTQPALDTRLTDKGSSVVFEPQLNISTSIQNRLGTLQLSALGQGFIFTEDARFNQGMLRLQAVQSLTSSTRLRVRYEYVPDQFLGDNEDRHPGQTGLVEERLTSNIWSARLEHNVTPDLEVKLLGRFGMRRYNEAFAERDLNFWTIGPHLDWRITPRVKLGLGYHYERGLADGRNQPELEDDVSYINHYVTGDLDIELMTRLSLLLAVHYERNNWTSQLVGDERNGAHETVFQGEAILVYEVDERVRVFTGVQRSNRKESFEPSAAKNTNVGVGVQATF